MTGDRLREQVAKAIMDAHCYDDWTGHSLADAALSIVNEELKLARRRRVAAAIYGSREATCPRPFALYRHKDVTGASGTGLVATGAEFDDGTTVLRWRGETPSTVVWPSLEAAQKVHGHDGCTHVVWLNEDITELSAAIERDERAKVEAELAELRAELASLRAEQAAP